MSLVVLALIGGGAKATEAVIASQVEVEKTGQISQIMLDDVMFSVPDSELMAADAPSELKEHISSARDTCLEKNEIWDSYWNCYGKRSEEHTSELQSRFDLVCRLLLEK